MTGFDGCEQRVYEYVHCCKATFVLLVWFGTRLQQYLHALLQTQRWNAARHSDGREGGKNNVQSFNVGMMESIL